MKPVEAEEVLRVAKEVLPQSSILREVREALLNLPESEQAIIQREASNLRKNILHLHAEGATELISRLGMFLIEKGM